jgi:hypothetical protein
MAVYRTGWARPRLGYIERLAIGVAIAGMVLSPRGADAQMAGMPGMPRGEPGAPDAVSSAMGGGLEEAPHMQMTALAAAKPGDTARAAAIVTVLRQALRPYADYHRALTDGYRIFAPKFKQHVYHFSSRRQGFMSVLRFDPAQPSSLLYEKTGDSSYRLVGAMYTAPRKATLAKLDARVPLSVAQWHVHTNWCLPPGGARGGNYDARGPDGRPLFGGRGSITTEAACTAAGGRFLPQVFGWMVHVYPFATDPAQVWGAEEMH